MDVFVLRIPEPLDDAYVSNFKRLQLSHLQDSLPQQPTINQSKSTSKKDYKTVSKKVEQKAEVSKKEKLEQKAEVETKTVVEQKAEVEQKTDVDEDDTHHEINFEQSKNNKSKNSSTPIEVELDRTHDATTPVAEEPMPNTLSQSEVKTIATMMASLPDTPTIITVPSSATQSVETKQKSKTVEKKKTTLRVADLRKLCEDNNLETFGVKEVLIKRLEKHNLL